MTTQWQWASAQDDRSHLERVVDTVAHRSLGVQVLVVGLDLAVVLLVLLPLGHGSLTEGTGVMAKAKALSQRLNGKSVKAKAQRLRLNGKGIKTKVYMMRYLLPGR